MSDGEFPCILGRMRHNLAILKVLRRFNLKFTKARYGMSGEIRYSGAASGWPG